MNIAIDTILSVKDLKTYIYVNNRCNRAVDGVSFNVFKGKTLGIVGESGCGKSISASSIMQLLPKLSRIESGEITYYAENENIRIDLLERNGKKMRSLRGADISMIFQDPMTALNPVYTIGSQIQENIMYHLSMSVKTMKDKTVEMLEKMEIPLAKQRAEEYPHQFSGGMRQRAMIALAMACNPKILIADEPTTALDVTIQAQIFELMQGLKDKHQTAIILITHDMGVIAELADDVAVMYMGSIVEKGTVDEVLRKPAHPYTKALLKSIPILGHGKKQKIEPIQGSTPDPYMRPKGCQFMPRCDYASDECSEFPQDVMLTGSHTAKCWKTTEVIRNA